MSFNVELNSKIRIYYKNGFQAEGIVKFWSNINGILISEQSQDKLLVNTSWDEILMIRILSDHKSVTNRVVEINREDDPKNLQLPEPEPDLNLRAKKLAELRMMQLEQHKQKLHKTMFENISEPRITNYDTPLQFAQSKGARTIGPNAAKLQNLRQQ